MNILILILINLFNIISSLPPIMKARDYEKLEKKAKILACSVLSDSSSIGKRSIKKDINDLLRKHKLIKGQYEAKEKVHEFMTAICYEKIQPETANDVLKSAQEGNFHFENYSNLFTYGPNINVRRTKELMNEVKEKLKEINDEDENEEEEEFDNEKYMNDLKKRFKRNLNYGMPGGGRVEGDFKDIDKEKTDPKKYYKGKKKKKKKPVKLNFFEEYYNKFISYVGIKNFHASLLFISMMSLFVINKKKKHSNLQKQN